MKVTASFSEGITQLLEGAAIGDELTITAQARIIGANEVLIDVTPLGQKEPTYVQGELEVKLLLSHPKA